MMYNALTQMKAKSADRGKYADGQGLWLVKRDKQFGKWMLRLVVSGKRREMGRALAGRIDCRKHGSGQRARASKCAMASTRLLIAKRPGEW